MQQVIMTVGLQASGKSTWAKKWVLESPGDRKRVNRDELRLMLDAGEWSPENEKYIVKVRDSILLQALRSKKSVVIDDTNLRADNFTKVCDLIAGAGLSAVVIEKPFHIEVEEAVKRDRERGERGGVSVGEKVIRDTWAKFIGKHGKLRDARTRTIVPEVAAGEPPSHVEGAPSAILCDLDGTLALMGDRSPYDASRCDELDKPNWPVIECVKAMHARGIKVLFMSGREDKDREATERFIEKWVRVPSIQNTTWNRPDNEEIITIPHELFMRPTGDQRKDSIVKRELFDTHVRGKYNVLFALDDRQQVVKEAWRAMGLTCFQVAEGNF